MRTAEPVRRACGYRPSVTVCYCLLLRRAWAQVTVSQTHLHSFRPSSVTVCYCLSLSVTVCYCLLQVTVSLSQTHLHSFRPSCLFGAAYVPASVGPAADGGGGGALTCDSPAAALAPATALLSLLSPDADPPPDSWLHGDAAVVGGGAASVLEHGALRLTTGDLSSAVWNHTVTDSHLWLTPLPPMADTTPTYG